MTDRFEAVVLREEGDGVRAAVETLSEADLPDGDVTVAVAWSDLNYKDGMILRGLGRLVRQYPHVPGIDFAGTVERSSDARFAPGDRVVLTGWRVGERHWGGFAGKARVDGDWLVRLPDGLTPRRAMGIGTAGLTAMLAVMALEREGLAPERGPVLVTGGAGGVGSVAIAILARLGYTVAASTGRPQTADYLRALGASEIVERAALADGPRKPLESERWAGVVDAVGGQTLAAVLAQLRYGAAVAAVGNAGGVSFSASVLPFLLRGVRLIGIDSVMCPVALREEAWRRLVSDLPPERLDGMIETVSLAEVIGMAPRILDGGVRGRVVVEIGGGA